MTGLAARGGLTLAAYRALGDTRLGLNPVQNSVRLVADQAIGALSPSEVELAALALTAYDDGGLQWGAGLHFRSREIVCASGWRCRSAAQSTHCPIGNVPENFVEGSDAARPPDYP